MQQAELSMLFQSTSIMEIFPATSTSEIIECTLTLRSTFKYATSDLPAFPAPRALKKLACGSPFQKALGVGNAGKVLSLVFEL